MHDAAFRFIARAFAQFPLRFGARILEIGSYNVNGSARAALPNPNAVTWHGIDVRPGPGVDEVADGRFYRPGARYDAVVVAETLEHCSDPQAIIETAWQCLNPGGMLIVTAAGPGRAPHGVDGGAVGAGEHYANIEPDALRAWLVGWRNVEVFYSERDCDVYAIAFRGDNA